MVVAPGSTPTAIPGMELVPAAPLVFDGHVVANTTATPYSSPLFAEADFAAPREYAPHAGSQIVCRSP